MKKLLAPLVATVLATGCSGLPPELQGVVGAAESAGLPAPVSESDIAEGLQQALLTGSRRAIARVGVHDGYWTHRDIVIPLPDELRKAEKTLRMLGQSQTVDEFHLSLNRAAEAAAPEAVSIFAAAIRGMTLSDARRILEGPNDAATQYFREKTVRSLTARFRPIVMQATSRVGVTRKYKDMTAKLGAYLPNARVQDLDTYVTERALSGLFHALAEEEYRIRKDPAARSSEILRRVFGGR